MTFNPLSAVLDIGDTLIKHFFPDPKDQDAAKLKLLELQQSGALAELTATTDLAKAQAAIDQQEAASGNMFIAGGRPFIIWVCGAAFALNYLVEPITSWILIIIGHQANLPKLDMSEMMPVLLGLLGLGGYRTYEKVQGVNSSHG